jgi:ferric-dicitrate binding protein FerR (iron transport regulator)
VQVTIRTLSSADDAPTPAEHEAPRVRTRTGRGVAVLAVLVAAVAGTGGCALVGAECSGFAIDFAEDAHGEDSPMAAVEAYSGHGTAGMPSSGWRQVGRDAGGVRLRSGSATLHVTRMPDGSWMVDSGSSC